MAFERENFNHTGPEQLANVDWSNHCHRRAVAAILVEEAYNLEYVHQGRQEHDRQHFFHFELKRKLQDHEDSSIYGAVYEINHANPNHLPERAPNYVIAFRGAILKPSTKRQDIELILKIAFDKLHRDKSRFQHALEVVKGFDQEAGSAKIWLAGHSLGSAIATGVGKSMALEGKVLETFLFNPPFWSSSLLNIIDNPCLKHGILRTKAIFKVGTSFVGGDHLLQEQYEQFKRLSSWIPNLFVNPEDPICLGYIDHFRNSQIQDEMTGGVPAPHSIRSQLKAAFGKVPQLPIHLFPKAHLTISKNSSSTNSCNILEAHALKQWWYEMSIGPGFADSSTNVSIGDPELVGVP